MTRPCLLFPLIASTLALAACGDTANLAVADGTGPDPRLPEPTTSMIPTVNVADAGSWGEGEMPVAAKGYKVQAFAAGLDHPRWIYVLPNGDVLVAETNGPPSEEDGIMAWIEKKIMGAAGAKVPSADRITLLRDSDGDGVADERHAFLTAENGLASPFGMALTGNGNFYVGNYAGLLEFPYTPGTDSISAKGRMVANFQTAGERPGHWTRNVIASPDGAKLYIAVGSATNVADNGLAVEQGRAAIHEYDVASGKMRPFATGIRNPVGMAFNPASGMLWTSVNERDELGSDLVPDYMTSVEDGGFYGWPWLYYGTRRDERAPGSPPQPTAITPDYALGPHTASLGLTFTPSGNGAVVGQHGSWNRKPRSGYRVVFVPFDGAQPSGKPQELLGGFLVDDTAKGRPVGVAFDGTGALLVADDVGNTIWRVTPSYPGPA